MIWFLRLIVTSDCFSFSLIFLSNQRNTTQVADDWMCFKKYTSWRLLLIFSRIISITGDNTICVSVMHLVWFDKQGKRLMLLMLKHVRIARNRYREKVCVSNMVYVYNFVCENMVDSYINHVKNDELAVNFPQWFSSYTHYSLKNVPCVRV